MEYLSVKGGAQLYGNAVIPAAKNSVLPILAASLMLSGESVIKNTPHLSDVSVSMEILSTLGCNVEMEDKELHVIPKSAGVHIIPAYLMAAMRSSVFYLSPLLTTARKALVSSPGGCHIGARPIDIHLDGLSKMGVKIEFENEMFTLSAPEKLNATDYTLRLPSVGATETLLMAASLAKGCTVLRGVAKEPEIEDLAGFLRAAGAEISGDGTDIITINGKSELYGASYTPYGDRITAATVLCATALCGGEVCTSGVSPMHTASTLKVLSKLGCGVKSRDKNVVLSSSGRCFSSGDLQTGVYPDFCTDAAPLVAAALLKAEGNSSISDNIFENRFECAKGFMAMGANVAVDGRKINITGTKNLHATALTAPDLRGGAALVIAALAAEGESTITGLIHIKRGYEDIAALFSALGANIRHIQ